MNKCSGVFYSNFRSWKEFQSRGISAHHSQLHKKWDTHESTLLLYRSYTTCETMIARIPVTSSLHHFGRVTVKASWDWLMHAACASHSTETVWAHPRWRSTKELQQRKYLIEGAPVISISNIRECIYGKCRRLKIINQQTCSCRSDWISRHLTPDNLINISKCQKNHKSTGNFIIFISKWLNRFNCWGDHSRYDWWDSVFLNNSKPKPSGCFHF